MATLADIDEMKRLNADFFEILIRKDDIEEDIEKVITGFEIELIVHAPEKLMEGALLDLASADEAIRLRSVERIQSLADIFEERGIPLVIHPGGVTKTKVDAVELKNNLIRSLESLDGSLWLENMPRRYHLGNELHHCNLMLHPNDFDWALPFIDGVTLDISHAFLSVEQGGNSAIASFFEHLKEKIRHIHLSDAAQPDREGLPLGTGEINLQSLPRMSNLPILLEIWGGHLNHAEGFGIALERVRADNSWFKGCVP